MALIDKGMENDLLKANEAGIMARLNPRMRRDVERLVVAGIKVATRGGTQGMMRNLPASKDPVRDCALGAVNLTFMMVKSQNPTPSDQVMAAAVHASYILMLQALDVAAKIGLIEITPEIIATATKTATDRIFAAVNLTPDKLRTAASKVNEVLRNPEQLEQMKRKIGESRDPRAPMVSETEEANGAD